MNLRDDDTPSPVFALPEEDDRFPSLQQRLERVARERDVLAVLRELARHGLREGDQVLNLRTSISGRLHVDCNAPDPVPVVDTDLGCCRVASLSEWQRCASA
jgi:hypothetical protein